MGTVISFPAQLALNARTVVSEPASATVIILPVVRIERFSDQPTGDLEPATSGPSRRRRRRRAVRT
jgi:hypothetical protein